MEAAPAGVDPEQIGHALGRPRRARRGRRPDVWEEPRASWRCRRRRRSSGRAPTATQLPARATAARLRASSGSSTRRSRSTTTRRPSRHSRSRFGGPPWGPTPASTRRRMRVVKPGPDREVPAASSAAPRSPRRPPARTTSTWAASASRPAPAPAPTTTMPARARCTCSAAACESAGATTSSSRSRSSRGTCSYVPPRVTHVVENVSDTEPADYVVARDSPHEDAVVVPGLRSRR